MSRISSTFNPALFVLLFLVSVPALFADPIPTLHFQGSSHGFLLLRDEAGKIVAVGDQINVTSGRRVRSRLVFRFRDGSIDDEVATFLQGKALTLLTDHHIQKGPSFPKPVDMSVNVPAGTLSWVESKDGKLESHSSKLAYPPDLANGIIAQLIQNYPARQSELHASMLAGVGKPRLVKLRISAQGSDRFLIGGSPRRSTLYTIHVDIGGITGAVAQILGKQPPDIHIWALKDEVPTILRMTGPFYQDGPIWTVTLASPTWSGEGVGH